MSPQLSHPTSLPVFYGVGATVALVGCTGNGSGDVTVNQLITMVSIALGNAQLSTCPVGDADGDGAITVDEIIRAVNNVLPGCG